MNENIEVSNKDIEVLDDSIDVEVVDSDSIDVIEALDKDSAEQLTRDIQSTTTALYVLIKRAHDTKAWLSLGYKTWTEYIEKEFDFSRARSYQLINQANVIEEINEASGVPLYITERDARSIKKRLPEITEKLKEAKDSEIDDDEMEEKAKEIIEESKEDIDNSSNVDFEGEKEYDEGYDDEYDDDSNGFSDNTDSNLSEDDKFYYENLIVTLKIFETMPNSVLFGEKIKKSNENKQDIIKLAESSKAWIDNFLEQLQ